jgi:dolichol kinase
MFVFSFSNVMKPKFQYIILFIIAFIILFVFFWLFQTKTKEGFTPYIRELYRPYVRRVRIHGSNLYKSTLQRLNRWNKFMF